MALTVQYYDLSTMIRCTVLYVKTRPGAIYSMFTGLSISVSSFVPALLTSVTEVFSCLCQMQMWSRPVAWTLYHCHTHTQAVDNPPPHTHTHIYARAQHITPGLPKEISLPSESPC